MADIGSILGNINVGDTISKYKSSTQQALTKYKGDAVKAISPVQNKLKEGVANLKAGEAKVTGMISGYKDEVVSNLDGLISTLTGGLVDFKDVSKYITVGKNGVSFDKQGVGSMLGSKIGLDLTSNNSVFYQLTDAVNSEFNELTGGYFGNLVSTDGEGFRITSSWRDRLGTGLLDVLGRTTGVGTNITDLTFNNAYYNSLMKMSAQYGMSDSYSSIMASYTNPEDAELALINAIPQMMQNGDLISMNKVLELVSKKGLAVINAKYPQLPNTLFQNFVLDAGTQPGQYPGIKAMFLKVVSTIYGDTWYKRNTAFGMVLNMGIISTVSDDMKKILVSDQTAPELTVLIACTGMFNEQSAVSNFQQYFSGVPILVDA